MKMTLKIIFQKKKSKTLQTSFFAVKILFHSHSHLSTTEQLNKLASLLSASLLNTSFLLLM